MMDVFSLLILILQFSLSPPTQASCSPPMDPEPPKPSGGRVFQIWHRELGRTKPRAFLRQLGASEAVVRRMNHCGNLPGHDGSVNSVNFNSSGDIVISSSDDKDVIFWSWETKTKKLAYPSGHHDSVYQAQVMPFTDDRTVITSGADGEVRVGHVADDGQVAIKLLGAYLGRVRKLTIEPSSPHVFYSCGTDGYVRRFDLRCPSSCMLFLCTSFVNIGQRLRLNTMAINPRNPRYLTVGGQDQYARLFDIRNCRWGDSVQSEQVVTTFCPRHLIGSNIISLTGIAYSSTGELLVSYNDEFVYLFHEDMAIGPNPVNASVAHLDRLDQVQIFSGHRNSQSVMGVSFLGPNDDYVVSGSDCAHIYIWRKMGGEVLCMMPGDRKIVSGVDPHPHLPFLASCGHDKDVKLWAPLGDRPDPLPRNAAMIMAANQLGRIARTWVKLSPDSAMHFLRMNGRDIPDYMLHRLLSAETEDDDESEGEPDVDDLSDSGFPSVWI